jgi:flagellar biosynthesis protein FlhB
MKKFLPIYLLILAIAISALPAFFCGQSVALASTDAAVQGLDEAAGAANLKSEKGAVELAGQIVQTVLSFLGIIFIILLLYGGFIRMTAQGSPDKVKQSTGIITSAIVGIIIIFVSYIVTVFVIKQVQQSVGDESTPSSTPVDNAGQCTTASDCSCPSYGIPTCLSNGECDCVQEGPSA